MPTSGTLGESLRAIAEGIRYVTGALSSSVILPREAGDSTLPYFDFDVYVRDPGYMESVAYWYVTAIRYIRALEEREGRRGPEIIAYIHKDYGNDPVTVGVAPLVGLVATHPDIRLPQVAVRLDRRRLPHNQVKIGEPGNMGRALQGVEAVLLTDHVTGGEELLHAILALKSYGAEVRNSVVFSVWPDRFENEYGPKVREQTTFHHLTSLAVEKSQVQDEVWAVPVPNNDLIRDIEKVLDLGLKDVARV